jgi:hypothetical protein
VLEHDHLPDCRGYFLRGVGGSAAVNPDASARTDPAKPGAVIGDRVGSIQGRATAIPSNPFTTDVQGNHTHDLLLEMSAAAGPAPPDGIGYP